MAGSYLPPVSGSAIADAAGAATVTLSVRGGYSWGIEHTRVTGGTTTGSTRVPTATTTLCDRPLEGTATGNNDQSDTYYVIDPGGWVTCTWAGCDPGARVTLTISGWQYPAGQAPSPRG